MIIRSLLLILLLFCAGARNPFEPMEKPVVRPAWNDPSVLKYYSFQELVLQAIIWRTEKNLALFRTPEGKTVIAKLETPVGKKGGKIVRIDDNMVVVKGSFGESFTFRIR